MTVMKKNWSKNIPKFDARLTTREQNTFSEKVPPSGKRQSKPRRWLKD